MQEVKLHGLRSRLEIGHSARYKKRGTLYVKHSCLVFAAYAGAPTCRNVQFPPNLNELIICITCLTS